MARRGTALALSGGVALGAYQAGACAALHEAPAELWPRHIAGSSTGALNAALLAGGPPAGRVERLQRFWQQAARDAAWPGAAAFGRALSGPARYAFSQFHASLTRLFGRAGVLKPRPEALAGGAPSVFDLSPLRGTLEALVDFARLNSGETRISVLATDMETGEAVIFDTGRGDRIGPEHLIASCSLPPDFPPVEIDGRILGDGGLIANVPLEAVLDDPGQAGEEELLCFIVELFSTVGERPRNVEESLGRAAELLLANQTRQFLRRFEREQRLRRTLGEGPSVRVVHISYRAPPHEPGLQRLFDFSSAALVERWQAGEKDMRASLAAVRA